MPTGNAIAGPPRRMFKTLRLRIRRSGHALPRFWRRAINL